MSARTLPARYPAGIAAVLTFDTAAPRCPLDEFYSDGTNSVWQVRAFSTFHECCAAPDGAVRESCRRAPTTILRSRYLWGTDRQLRLTGDTIPPPTSLRGSDFTQDYLLRRCAPGRPDGVLAFDGLYAGGLVDLGLTLQTGGLALSSSPFQTIKPRAFL